MSLKNEMEPSALPCPHRKGSTREKDRPFDLKDNERSLSVRFWIYQKERFPLQQYLPIVAAFTFSASGYSIMSGGRTGLIGWWVMAAGIATSFGLFFLLRLFDEFKDAEDDAKYRPYRAVPRGLVSFGELRALILGVIAFMVAANACVAPALLAPLALSIGYLLIMWREFFVPAWLRRHPVVYMLSHMMVMPLIDFYTSGLDWIVGGFRLPTGMFLFLALTFTNGCIIEIGRKIRIPEDEEPGVETYSALWGGFRAAAIWLVLLTITWALSLGCCHARGFLAKGAMWLTPSFLLSAAPAVAFLFGRKTGRGIEAASGIWTIAMYVFVGMVPHLCGWGAR